MSVKGDSDDSNASVETQFSRASSTAVDVSLDNAADGDDGSGTSVSACEVPVGHIDSVDDDRVSSELAAGKPMMSDDVLPVADRCCHQSPAAGVAAVSCAGVNLPLVEDGLSSGHVTDTEADDVDRSSEAVCSSHSQQLSVDELMCESRHRVDMSHLVNTRHCDASDDDVDRSSEAVCSSQQLSVDELMCESRHRLDISHLVNTRHCDASDDDDRAVTCADSHLQQVPVCITRSHVICCLSVSGTISVKFSLDVNGWPRY